MKDLWYWAPPLSTISSSPSLYNYGRPVRFRYGSCNNLVLRLFTLAPSKPQPRSFDPQYSLGPLSISTDPLHWAYPLFALRSSPWLSSFMRASRLIRGGLDIYEKGSDLFLSHNCISEYWPTTNTVKRLV
jgi:hypothetical protein